MLFRSAFVLGSGRVVTVEKGWKGAEDERGFLREVHMGGCGIFGTALGPGSNALHYNHFHVDMARHNARNSGYCKPIIDVPPRVDPLQAQIHTQPSQLQVYKKPSIPVYKQETLPEISTDELEQEEFDSSKFDLTSSIKPRRKH